MNCSPPASSFHGDSPGKNIGVVCHALLQGIFPTHGLNLGPLHWRGVFTIGVTSSFLLFSSVAQSCPTLCDPMDCSTSGLPVHHNSQSLLRLMSIESVMPSNHFIFCQPLFLLPSISPSTRVLSNDSALHLRQPKCWSFSFNISPSNEHSGLMCFRMDWLNRLAVQETLKSLLQHHISKAYVLLCSAFFIVQLSTSIHDYWKTIALTRWISVGRVMSLLFNMLSTLVI